ncbi:MAG: hypothetical protein ACK4TC_03550 [Sphingomonas pseudosanguinis]|uniref:hypothetical protein n=1 Tax=Sphingomonas pseudosanguinis TaxID=413712 RepID=UPI003919FB7A
MMRRDKDYWQRLRKDPRSNWAAGMAALAAIAASVMLIGLLVEGSQYQARTNPLYWILMLPAVWWSTGLARFEPRPVRWWKPALLLCVAIAGAVLALAIDSGDGMPEAIGFALTLIGAVSSMVLLRDSLVAREGPAR